MGRERGGREREWGGRGVRERRGGGGTKNLGEILSDRDQISDAMQVRGRERDGVGER